MPQHTYLMTADEPTLPVLIGLNAQKSQALVAAGRSLPTPVWGTGYLDTGTNVTCVAANVLRQLGLQATMQASTQTASGLAAVNLYEVSLSIPTPGPSPGIILTRTSLLVMELANAIPGIEVLIGLDILLDCKFFLDGPTRRFSLEF